MKSNKTIRKLRFQLGFFPLTIHGIILALALWACFSILKPAAPMLKETTSSFLPFLILLGKTALWFFLALALLSLGSAAVCWLYYLWMRRKNGKLTAFSFHPDPKKTGGIRLTALIRKARRPFLGAIKSRLVYDDYRMTEKFLLSGNRRQKRHLWRVGVAADREIQLPDIKEYELKGNVIYFEDMLQLCAFSVFEKRQGHFFSAPRKIAFPSREAKPQHTEDADIRIEDLRRIQGDYLNYKNFESGDDIRRIVWKIYAKNKELVVKVAEQKDRYASHLYCFASFHTDLPAVRTTSIFADEMLNYYKNRIWSVYEVLVSQDLPVKFLPDQPMKQQDENGQDEAVQRIISNSQWQRARDLIDYFPVRRGSVLCISSFNDPDEIAETLAHCSRETVVYYIRLSDTFRHNAAISWLGRLFLRPPEDRLKRIRDRWLFQPLRLQLQKREKEIEERLQKADVSVGRL